MKLNEQQVADTILREVLSNNGARRLLNGDYVSFNLSEITAMVNAALATQPAAGVPEDIRREALEEARDIVLHHLGHDIDLLSIADDIRAALTKDKK